MTSGEDSVQILIIVVGAVALLAGVVLLFLSGRTGTADADASLKLPGGIELKSKNPAIVVSLLGGVLIVTAFARGASSPEAKADPDKRDKPEALGLLQPPSAAEETITYQARIGAQDHCSSRGHALSSAADILRQDRANRHKFERFDDADGNEDWLRDERQRQALQELADRPESIGPTLREKIVGGTPLLRVTLHRQQGQLTRMEVELLEDGPAPEPCGS
jgi:hypothetical protein